ncbi:hypothetical protein ACFWUQ_04475 [Streptomyces sp. NPDC058662]|uniref:hypothetical protein n=1 Tax=Streptomyces sp. NPDC058662 TaxID=3346583 RepID=UPI00365644E9
MSTLIALIYTTAGGIVGSIATTAFSQGRDRRTARADLRKALHQVFRAGTMLRNMRAELQDFHNHIADLEIMALTAGAPRSLVALHQQFRRDLYQINSFAQILDDSNAFPPSWYQLARDRGDLAMAVEAQLQAFTWHPWRTRFSLPWRLRKLRRAQVAIDAQNADNWRAFEVHRNHCIELEIARSNNQQDHTESSTSSAQSDSD